jgi:hypothetical protein
VENLAFILIAFFGFASGCSSRINPYGVPQREPNLFWIGIAGFIGLFTIWNGSITISVPLFVALNVVIFCLATVAGALIVWLFRKGTPLVND